MEVNDKNINDSNITPKKEIKFTSLPLQYAKTTNAKANGTINKKWKMLCPKKTQIGRTLKVAYISIVAIPLLKAMEAACILMKIEIAMEQNNPTP